MLEILISVLIIMVGVLGVGGIQMYAINNTNNASYQSDAVMLASSMATKMQANVAYWGTPASSVTVSGSTITGGPSTYTGTCIGTVCTGAQMASFDLQQWGAAVAAALPSGTAKLACSTPAGVPAICTITLTWSEMNVALANATGTESGVLATGTVNSNYTYQTLVNMQL